MKVPRRVLRQLGIPPANEAEFTADVIDLAHDCGWKVAHFRAARTLHGWRTAVSGDGEGFVDLIMTRGERILAVELKMPGKRPTAKQQAWLRAFRMAGVPAFCWRPEDWGRIEEMLE